MVANMAWTAVADGRQADGEVSTVSFPDAWCTRATGLGVLAHTEQ
jgi:hypothetical protein